ncbi:MAG: hypothetical protein WC356_00680 [Candidatus Micrarchaeia archaeon]|jgi:hypothetical protein
MKIYILIFLFISLLFFGCLAVEEKKCLAMSEGETKDECYTFYAVGEYLKTNDTSIEKICKNEMSNNESSILCYQALGVAAAHQDHNFHAVSFCEEIYFIESKDSYNNLIDCLTEVAVIIGDETICEHASNRFDPDKSLWSKLLFTQGVSTNMKLDICKKRALMTKARKENLPIEFF